MFRPRRRCCPAGFIPAGLCALSLLVAVEGVTGAEAPFSSAYRSFPTDGRPLAVALLDLTGDGRPEVVAANVTTNSLTLFLNSGSGALTNSRQILVDPNPGSFAVADFNADGVPDLAVACRAVDTIWLLSGKRDGTLTSIRALGTRTEPWEVRSADLNGDGLPDLAVTCRTAGVVQTFANQGGNFNFSAPVTLPTGRQPTSLVLGDATGDGRTDILSANFEGDTVTLYRGEPGGGSRTRVDIPTAVAPVALALLDVDRDGRPDLTLLRDDAPEVIVHRGGGAGVFDQTESYFPPGLAEDPVTLYVADFDADGHDELVTAQGQTEYLALRRTGATGLGPLELQVAGRNSVSFAAGDMNGDGRLDIVTANYSLQTVSVALGNGDNTFGSLRTVPGAGIPGTLALVDVDADGRRDLITLEPLENRVAVRRGRGNLSFGPPLLLDAGYDPTGLVVEDVTGDGLPELVVSSRWDARRPHRGLLTLFRGLGGALFGERVDLETAEGASGVAVPDLNADRIPDLAVACEASNFVSVFGSLSGGGYAPRADLRRSTGPIDVKAGDFDNDGFMDLVVAHDSGRALVYWRGKGDGTLTYRSTLPTVGRPTSLATGFLGGRTVPSLLVTIRGLNELWIVDATPDGLLYVRQSILVGAGPEHAAIVDLNSDGFPDAATANQDASTVSFLFGSDSGSLGERIDLGIPEKPSSLAFGDLNGDGTPDLALGTIGPNRLLVFGNLIALPTERTAPAPVSADVGGPLLTGVGPNPFRNRAGIEFQVSRTAHVGLHVFDVTGRRRRRLADGPVAPGLSRVEWDGRDDAGRPVPPGLYFIQLETPEGRVSRKIVRLP